MIITLENGQISKKIFEGDLIAVVKNGKFIGYGEILSRLSDVVLVKLENKCSKTFTELYGEDIPYDFRIDD